MTARTRTTSKRIRLLAVLAVLIIGLTTTTLWAADTGIFAVPTIEPPAGTSASGSALTYSPLTPSQVTVPVGNATRVAGLALGKVVVAQGFALRTKVDVSWLDSQDAHKVLQNPHGFFTFGLYFPVHTGACTGSETGTVVSVTDGSTLCSRLDPASTGQYMVDNEIIISASQISGFMMIGTQDPTNTACGSTGSTWCAPSALNSANQNVFYVVATINTPGGSPQGQQGQTASLSFYVAAHAA